ncbi:MAG: acyl-coenzyme A thioesterase PaaI-like protein [Saprospiraceae bacterium]|jgi:acyl-coenzyme A thioesterase PaaI-like protein|tara:strand:- start:155 stop:607 length:453 start_codon:yes stop_codon:yes gene_type:complete
MINIKKLFKYKKLINLYPPFLGAGIRLKEYSKEGNSYLVEMKLRWYNRNVAGTHFGGSLYSMCDPFFVFAAYSYFGDDYIIWDKSASIEYVRPSMGTVRALFEIPLDVLKEMKAEVDQEGRKTFHFKTDILDMKNRVVSKINKEIYIKKK